MIKKDERKGIEKNKSYRENLEYDRKKKRQNDRTQFETVGNTSTNIRGND